MAEQNNIAIPLGVNQFIAIKNMSASSGDIKMTIQSYLDELKMLATYAKSVKTKRPERMSHEQAYEYFRMQFSRGGMGFPIVKMMELRLETVDYFILMDYRDKLHDLLTAIYDDLHKQGLYDWDKVEQSIKLLPLQGGGFQFIGRDNPKFR